MSAGVILSVGIPLDLAGSYCRRHAAALGQLASAVTLTFAIVTTACAQPSSQAPTSSAQATALLASPSPDAALIELLTSGRIPAYAATYTLVTMVNGTPTTSTLTQFRKPPYSRTDTMLTAAGHTDFVSTIVRPEGTFVCGRVLGPNPACFRVRSVTASVPFVDDLVGRELIPTGGRAIAGTEARCFVLRSPAATSPQTSGCYTSEGIPLYTSTQNATSVMDLTATGFSTQVTDADFALPYAVRDLPAPP